MVIIGAGQAGLQVAEALRSDGYDGAITMIGDEPRPPYQRPPLSKAYLLGEFTEAQLTLRAPEVLARKNITLLSGVSVTAVDRAAKQVRLSDGRAIDYAGLCLATGSRPRPLPVPGADLANVLPLRTLADTRAIAAILPKTERVLVIGGGFIGLEFAAVARKLGKEVVVLEGAERLMPRAVTPMMSEFFRKLHVDHGVAVELNAAVSRLTGAEGKVAAVCTADGREFPADLVLVGIGILPNVELAQATGLECERGIVVDACSRTADAAIVAAGDCTARRLPDGSLLRLESVQNAIEQGKSAAAALLGKERPFVASPWFWSDQYDVKLQMVGLANGHDRTVMRGAPASHKFSAFHYRGDVLLAVDSVNRPEDHMPARKLLDQGLSPSFAQVADLGIPLIAR
ncbi:MAG: FAD-dependent oxidoreductase [Rhodocyclales bacterium]|nr:FAD-dependent oxidoreductase [Rhodocyclales bacterium]